MNFDIYCDESGNTGTNYLDENQPLFVLSGWMVERNLSYRAKNRVQFLKDKHYPQATELKGSKLLKNSKGRLFCSNLIFGEMGKSGCVPFFIVAEKRYAIAAKMVESFLDPAYNPHISNAFSWMNAKKKQIVKIICSISNGSIEKYAEAHKTPNYTSIMESYLLLLNECELNGYNELVYALEGVGENLQKVLDEETTTMNAVEKSAMHTLNYPIFVRFLQLVEKFSDTVNLNKVRFFHDETAQFQKAYPEVYQLFAASKRKDEFVLEDGASIMLSTQKIKTFEMIDSKKFPLLQAADILSSTINYYLTRLYKEEEVEPELDKISDLLIGSSLASEEFYGNGFCDFMVSEDLFERLFLEKGIISKRDKGPLPMPDIKPFLISR